MQLFNLDNFKQLLFILNLQQKILIKGKYYLTKTRRMNFEIIFVLTHFNSLFITHCMLQYNTFAAFHNPKYLNFK